MTDAPRWLDEREQAAWRAYLGMTTLLHHQLERELQRAAGMPHAYYEILVRLSEAPERSLRMSRLAELTLSSRGRLSHAVARLEEEGWVVREPCATDGRGLVARLTAEGYAVLEAAAPEHVAGVRRHLFDQLSATEVDQLRTIATKVLTHLQAQDGAPACPAPTESPARA